MPRNLIMTGLLALFLFAVTGCGGDAGSPAADTPRVAVARQLTDADDIYQANPIYSPDGQWILYESEAAGNRDIWRLPAAGGVAEQLTTDPGFDSSPYWAPDGSSFVFESDRSGTKCIWTLDLSVPGAVPVRLTDDEGDDGSPAWSPDGTRIVYESDRRRSGGSDLWVSPVGGGTALRLTDTGEGIYHRTADWSPDGTRVVFESNREIDGVALYVMSALGGVARRITAVPAYEGHPAWSPDGERIAFEATTTGTMEIFVVAATGGDPVQVTTGGGFWPRWSPDGGSLIYGVYGDGEPNLWTIEIAP